jgi:hypothetical protein
MIQKCILLLVIPLSQIAIAQTATDLSTKYHSAIYYEIRPGVIMLPQFATDGQVCEMDIERWHKTESGVNFGSSFTNTEVRQIVDELVSQRERGNDVTEPLNSFVDGGFSTTQYKYGNIIVTVHGITRPQPEDMVITITWTKRTCNAVIRQNTIRP